MRTLLSLIALGLTLVEYAGAQTSSKEDFEKSGKLPDGWETKGDVSVASDEKFAGSRSLRMTRAPANFDVETSAISPAINFTPGLAEVAGAFKSHLHSPDTSFHAGIALQCLNETGRVIESHRIAEPGGTTNWTLLKKRVQLPAGTATVRLRIDFEKTHGEFWADDLSITQVAASSEKKSPVARVLLKTSYPGNILYPEDKLAFDITVETTAPLSIDQPALSYAVRDYWGAEQVTRAELTLEGKGSEKGVFLYRANLDLSATRFLTGKYYELNVTMETGDGTEPARAFSSFVFLPKAEAKNHPWREIPFSSRNWDNRIPDYFTLSDRIGLPLIGIWGGWKTEPPYTPVAPGIEYCRKNGVGVLTRTPIIEIEHHRPGYKQITEQVLREGLHRFFEKFGGDDLVFVLGNEPESSGPSVAANVAAYKLMYEEIKKISPGTFVVGTSIGPAEEYFKLGFQNYCDAVDFHTYEDAAGVPKTFEKYEQLFQKYGGRKPIWSTESGLNSQGLPRRAVAADLIKKVTIFFAQGGQNISWFGICYPDRLGKLQGASDDSFNVFNGLYGLYSPRLDAIAYYNMVNGICVKKFVAQKRYGNDVQAYLFRDKEDRILQVLWSDHGAQDAFVPLPAGKVQMTRIDGSLEELNAAQKGLSLRLGEDPILLSYQCAQASLPDTLGKPLAGLTSVPDHITRGAPSKLTLNVPGGAKDRLEIKLPPSWSGKVSPTDADGKVEIVLTSPPDTEARYVPISVLLRDSNAGDTDLSLAVPVQSQLSAEIMPVPVTPAGVPAVELILRNNDTHPQTVQWQVALAKEIPVRAGRYSLEVTKAPEAYFAEAAQGQAALEGHGTTKIRLPIANLDFLSSYKVTASITDQLARSTNLSRFVGGFVGVPKASSELHLDGVPDEPDWQRCQPQKLGDERQFRHLEKTSQWSGPADLSGELRFLWDERYLYIAVNVTDEVFRNEAEDGSLWSGDGVQLLIDPARTSEEKPGKYDLGMALTKKGPQAWCFMSGDTRVPRGAATDITVAAKKTGDGTGAISYEIAVPWSRLLPFQPSVGANLGLAAALNEDDSPKRDGFMAWFGDIQSKELSPVGDLILTE